MPTTNIQIEVPDTDVFEQYLSRGGRIPEYAGFYLDESSPMPTPTPAPAPALMPEPSNRARLAEAQRIVDDSGYGSHRVLYAIPGPFPNPDINYAVEAVAYNGSRAIFTFKITGRSAVLRFHNSYTEADFIHRLRRQRQPVEPYYQNQLLQRRLLLAKLMSGGAAESQMFLDFVQDGEPEPAVTTPEYRRTARTPRWRKNLATERMNRLRARRVLELGELEVLLTPESRIGQRSYDAALRRERRAQERQYEQERRVRREQELAEQAARREQEIAAETARRQAARESQRAVRRSAEAVSALTEQAQATTEAVRQFTASARTARSWTDFMVEAEARMIPVNWSMNARPVEAEPENYNRLEDSAETF